jgi:hypothetical protein
MVAIALAALRAFVTNFLLKRLMGTLLKDTRLQEKIFFWLAQKIVDNTETQADNEMLDMIKQSLGYTPDTADIGR